MDDSTYQLQEHRKPKNKIQLDLMFLDDGISGWQLCDYKEFAAEEEDDEGDEE